MIAPLAVEAQREHARKTVTEFVTKWLLEQERWKTIKARTGEGLFADEPIERLKTFGPEFVAAAQ